MKWLILFVVLVLGLFMINRKVSKQTQVIEQLPAFSTSKHQEGTDTSAASPVRIIEPLTYSYMSNGTTSKVILNGHSRHYVQGELTPLGVMVAVSPDRLVFLTPTGPRHYDKTKTGPSTALARASEERAASGGDSRFGFAPVEPARKFRLGDLPRINRNLKSGDTPSTDIITNLGLNK